MGNVLWIAFWVVLVAFLFVSNYASYRLGYSRGLLKGIITSEMFRVRDAADSELARLIMQGDTSRARDQVFGGLEVKDR